MQYLVYNEKWSNFKYWNWNNWRKWQCAWALTCLKGMTPGHQHHWHQGINWIPDSTLTLSQSLSATEVTKLKTFHKLIENCSEWDTLFTLYLSSKNFCRSLSTFKTNFSPFHQVQNLKCRWWSTSSSWRSFSRGLLTTWLPLLRLNQTNPDPKHGMPPRALQIRQPWWIHLCPSIPIWWEGFGGLDSLLRPCRIWLLWAAIHTTLSQHLAPFPMVRFQFYELHRTASPRQCGASGRSSRLWALSISRSQLRRKEASELAGLALETPPDIGALGRATQSVLSNGLSLELCHQIQNDC